MNSEAKPFEAKLDTPPETIFDDLQLLEEKYAHGVTHDCFDDTVSLFVAYLIKVEKLLKESTESAHYDDFMTKTGLDKFRYGLLNALLTQDGSDAKGIDTGSYVLVESHKGITGFSDGAKSFEMY